MTGEVPDPENHAAKGLGTASQLGFAKSLCKWFGLCGIDGRRP